MVNVPVSDMVIFVYISENMLSKNNKCSFSLLKFFLVLKKSEKVLYLTSCQYPLSNLLQFGTFITSI